MRQRILLLLIQLSVLSGAAHAQEVMIDAVERGRGILRSRGTECFVIVPEHVVSGSMPRIAVRGAAGMTSVAEVVRSFDPDLAILRLLPGGSLQCEEWLPLTDFAAVLKSTTGTLVLREAAGSRSTMAVNVRNVDEETVSILPARSGDQFMKSMSGGSLFLNGALAGLLMSVDSTGSGKVIQLDDIIRLTSPFFGEASTQTRPNRAIDLNAAQAILSRAVDARNGSQQGQAEAIQTLMGAKFEFRGVDWSGLSLRGATLSHGVFSASKMHLVDFSEVNAQSVDLSGADLRFANLSGGRFDDAKFSRSFAPFLSARGASFEGASVSQSNFFGSDLRDVNFQRANLRGVTFALADLRGARFDGADLTDATFFASLVDSASFADATIRNTDFIAASSARFDLTARQRAGVCRRDGLNTQGDVVWHVNLMQARRSDRFASGLEFDQLLDEYGRLPFGENRSLPRCLASTDSAVVFDKRFPADISLRLGSEYLSAGTRRPDASKRVLDHFTLLASRRSPQRALRGDSAEAKSITPALLAGANRARPIGQPHLNADVLLLALLHAGVLDESQIKWDALARREHFFESDLLRRHKATMSEHSMWPPLYPEGSAWAELPAERATAYRTWAMARRAAAPTRLLIREVFNAFPSSGGATSLARIDWFEGPLRPADTDQQSRELAAAAGLKADAVSLALLEATDLGLTGVLLTWSAPIADYALEPPSEFVQMGGLQIQVDVAIVGIERVRTEAGGFVAIIRIKPEAASLFKSDTRVWTGLISVRKAQ